MTPVDKPAQIDARYRSRSDARQRADDHWIVAALKGQIGKRLLLDRGIVRNGKDPHWVQQREDGAFELYPGRVQAIKKMIDLFLAGHGAMEIERILSERELYVSNAGNYSTHMYRIVRNRALFGEKSLTVDGEEFRLTGYYPAFLTDEEFATLRDSMRERGRWKGKGEIPGILSRTCEIQAAASSCAQGDLVAS
ncbi:recombinase family protein [Burkholderia stabilis]|uniref:recombinase family protein n=1 Tax=Burkholderia stabilis TaxID=95485 RepID=UPI001F0BB3FB|nr:recombinase family protein [Burkholderia stabilis]